MSNPKVPVVRLFKAVVVLYVMLEVTSFVFFRWREGYWFSFAHHQQLRSSVIGDIPSPPDERFALRTRQSEVLHPYLGYVKDPTENPNQYSEHGFLGRSTPFHANEDDLVIAVFGGSFADGVARAAMSEFDNILRSSRKAGDNEVVVLNLAIGGYKQPQQLLALTYFIALGAHFDAVVNVDGFNEVAIAPAEFGEVVYPFYPRGWAGRVSNLIDPMMLRLIARITEYDDRILHLANTASTPPLPWTVTGNVLWRYSHISLQNTRDHLAQQLEDHVTDRTDAFQYVATGPSFPYRDHEALYRALASTWRASSLQMDLLCRSNGIIYLHFLQPNQYLAGSKPMGKKERSVAIRNDQPYRIGVERGYPLLIEAGRTLTRDGVRFEDLTMVFSSQNEQLYRDDCCHLTEEGYRLIAQRVGETLANFLD